MKKFLAVMIFLLMIAAQASAMDLRLNRGVDWHVGLGGAQKLQIKGYSRLDGDFTKGVAVFGDKLYLYFDATLFEEIRTKRKTFEQIEPLVSRFGGSNFEKCVPVFVFEGSTDIFPISNDDGRDFYLLATETGGGGSIKVIGERGSSWVKFFDTQDVYRTRQMAHDYYIKDFFATGDKIIISYEQWETKKICRLVYTWDETTQWFNLEVIHH